MNNDWEQFRMMAAALMYEYRRLPVDDEHYHPPVCESATRKRSKGMTTEEQLVAIRAALDLVRSIQREFKNPVFPPPEGSFPEKLLAEANEVDVILRGIVCEWWSDGDDVWYGSCDNVWTLEADGPKENEMNFCPHCGRPLVQKDDSNGEA